LSARAELAGLALRGALLALPLAAPALADETAAVSEGALAEQGPVEVVADRVIFAEDIVSGSGTVRLRFGGQTAEATRFRLDRTTGELELHDGSWTRAEGTTGFAEARIALTDRSGVMVGARFEGADGRLAVSGAQATIDGDGRLRGEGVVVRTCGCEVAPWSMEARRVVVVLDEEVRFTGGWIRVCEARIVPVPAGLLPLAARRTGLLMPEVGYGRDGFLVGLPVAVVVAPWLDLRLEPEWRSERGVRGLGELRAGLAPDEVLELRGAIGRDLVTEERRGAMEAALGFTPGRARLAADSRWWSDAAYLADYGGDFLRRRAPWAESRALLGWGPARLETQAFGHANDQSEWREQRPIAGAVELRGLDLGPVVAEAGARVDLLGQDAGPGEIVEVAARGLADVGLMGSHEVGPLRGELVFTGLGVAWEDSPAWARTSGGAGVALDTWGELGDVRAVGAWTIEARASAETADALVRAPDEAAGPMWWAGPGWRGQLLASGALPAHATVRAGFSSEGWWPEGRLRLGQGAWTARLQADPSLQDVRLGWRPAGVSLEAGTVRHAELWQAASGVAVPLWGPLAGLEPAWRGLASVPERTLLSHGPALRYRSPCDCLEVDLGATWARDRELPDLRFDLRVY